jgi:hypothetical protein
LTSAERSENIRVVSVVELARRCAWCNRVWTAEGWEDSPEAEADYETSTICPDCVDSLTKLGLTASA